MRSVQADTISVFAEEVCLAFFALAGGAAADGPPSAEMPGSSLLQLLRTWDYDMAADSAASAVSAAASAAPRHALCVEHHP